MPIEDYLADIQSATGGAKGEAESASNYFTGLLGESGGLPSKLKEALGKKLNYNEDLIGQQNTAMGEYFAAPAVAREKFQNVWNPFEREKLVQQDKSQAMSKWGTFSDLLGQRMGQVSDIVGEGVQGWQSVVQAAQAAAQAAQQKYQSILAEYMNAAGLQNQADERAMQESQFNQNLAWDKDKFAQQLANSGSGGGGSGASYASLNNSDKEQVNAYVQMALRSPDFDTDNVPAKLRGAFFVQLNNMMNLQKRAEGPGVDLTPVQPKTPINLGMFAPTAKNYPLTNNVLNAVGNWNIPFVDKTLNQYLGR